MKPNGKWSFYLDNEDYVCQDWFDNEDYVCQDWFDTDDDD